MRILHYTLVLLTLATFSCDSQKMKTSDKLSTNLKEEGTDNLLFDCYNGTQLEMNVCSLKELEFYDSILQNRINQLTIILDSTLLIESHYADSMEYLETKDLKNAIILSQETWLELRNRNSQIIGLKYKGASMENMVRNQQMTKDTKDRIRLIEEIINDELE